MLTYLMMNLIVCWSSRNLRKDQACLAIKKMIFLPVAIKIKVNRITKILNKSLAAFQYR